MTRLLDAVEWCVGSHTMNRLRWRLESLLAWADSRETQYAVRCEGRTLQAKTREAAEVWAARYRGMELPASVVQRKVTDWTVAPPAPAESALSDSPPTIG